MRAATSAVHFSVSRVVAWAPGVSTRDEWRQWARGERAIERDGEASPRTDPAMLRRQRGTTGANGVRRRLRCFSTARAISDGPLLPLRRGRTFGSPCFSALARGSDLSPTSFGLSVHNAVEGLFSMARRRHRELHRTRRRRRIGRVRDARDVRPVPRRSGTRAARRRRLPASGGVRELRRRGARGVRLGVSRGATRCGRAVAHVELLPGTRSARAARNRAIASLPAALSTLRFLFGESPGQDHHAGDRRWAVGPQCLTRSAARGGYSQPGFSFLVFGLGGCSSAGWCFHSATGAADGRGGTRCRDEILSGAPFAFFGRTDARALACFLRADRI